MSRKKGSSHIQDAGFLKRFGIKAAAWRQEFTLVPPSSNWMKPSFECQALSLQAQHKCPAVMPPPRQQSVIRAPAAQLIRKISKCDSAWIWIWRQSRNCNQLRTLKTEKNNSLQRTFQCGSNSLLGAMKAKGSAQAAESLGRLSCEKAAQSAVTWPALLYDQFCPDSLSNTDFLDTLGQDSSQLILTT